MLFWKASRWSQSGPRWGPNVSRNGSEGIPGVPKWAQMGSFRFATFHGGVRFGRFAAVRMSRLYTHMIFRGSSVTYVKRYVLCNILYVCVYIISHVHIHILFPKALRAGFSFRFPFRGPGVGSASAPPLGTDCHAPMGAQKAGGSPRTAAAPAWLHVVALAPITPPRG